MRAPGAMRQMVISGVALSGYTSSLRMITRQASTRVEQAVLGKVIRKSLQQLDMLACRPLLGDMIV